MTDVVALVGRTSDRANGRAAGAQALAHELSADARVFGEPGEPRAGRYDEDLRDARATLEAAAVTVAVTRRPLLTATDCSICVATVPVVARRWPDALLLWLDAHGDFNTPDTTPSGFLGGMCLAATVDVDTLDPTGMPGQLYPAPGGLDTTQLRDLLADVAARARIVGAEITCFSTPELSGVLAQAAAPLLESPAP